MPLPSEHLLAQSIAYTGFSSQTWKVSFYSLQSDDDVLLGYLVNTTGSTTVSAITSTLGMKLVFEENGATLDITNTNYLTFTGNSASQTVYLPAIAKDITIYIDTNNVAFYDEDLTMPCFGAIQEESLEMTEDEGTPNGSIEEDINLVEELEVLELSDQLETILLSESARSESYKETEDKVRLLENKEIIRYKETLELVKLVESGEVNRNLKEAEESVVISEDTYVAFTYAEEFVTLAESKYYTGHNTIDYTYFRTSALDFYNRGIKRTQAIHVGLRTDGTVTVALQFRFDPANDFTTTSFKPLNKGQAILISAGLEFKVIIKVANPTYCKLDYIKLELQQDDKRFIRSPYA